MIPSGGGCARAELGRDFYFYHPMTYAQLLKDPRWDVRRKEIYRRDNWTCQLCGLTDTEVQVHHLYYLDHKPDPWDYPDEALITLCAGCHELEEYHKNFTFYGVRYLTELGVMHTDIDRIIRTISDAKNRTDFPGMRDYIFRLLQHMRHA